MEIFVDNDGYNQFFEELEKLKKESLLNSSFGSQACVDAIGDGWHDNFSFEESMRESKIIATKIDNMLIQSKGLKIVSNEDINDACIKIGDTVELEFYYEEGEKDCDFVILTGKYIPNAYSEPKEITLNSPLGSAIFRAKIGTMVTYTVGKNLFKVYIKRKIINKY